MNTGITYYSDFRNLNSIMNPMIDNNSEMRYGGTFLTNSNGLKKTKYNKGYIYCEDASKLFNIYKGRVALTLQFSNDIIKGVYSSISDTASDYLLWGVNIDQNGSDIRCPSISAKLTKSGIKFTISSSLGEYSIIDNTTNVYAGETVYIEFMWDSERHYSGSNYFVGISEFGNLGSDFWGTMAIRINNDSNPSAIGNAPISLIDSLSGLSFYALDTLYSYSNMECTLRSMIIANEFITNEFEDNESSSESSVSSDMQNILPNNGAISIASNGCQRVSYCSGIISATNNFSNKTETDVTLIASNRHLIDQAWETNNIYYIQNGVNTQVTKTNFNGNVLATSSVLSSNAKSICVNQRMLIPDDPNDYIQESGCSVITVDLSNNVYLNNYDNNLNLIGSPIKLTLSYTFGNKIHIIPSFTGSDNTYSSYNKFALIYSKWGNESFWYMDYFDISQSTSAIYSCNGSFSENYCIDSNGYSHCFPMDDRTQAFLTGNELWAITGRVNGTTNFSREKIRIFNSGVLSKTVDPSYDIYGALADNSRISDMDINYANPDFIITIGEYGNVSSNVYSNVWIARYDSYGNFTSNVFTSAIGSPLYPTTAIKCVQSSTSTFFYLLESN